MVCKCTKSICEHCVCHQNGNLCDEGCSCDPEKSVRSNTTFYESSENGEVNCKCTKAICERCVCHKNGNLCNEGCSCDPEKCVRRNHTDEKSSENGEVNCKCTESICEYCVCHQNGNLCVEGCSCDPEKCVRRYYSSNYVCSVFVNDESVPVIEMSHDDDNSTVVDAPSNSNDMTSTLLSVNDDFVRRRSASVLEMSVFAQNKLKYELDKAQTECKIQKEVRQKVEQIQEEMNEELVELTAQLFQDANEKVIDANVKRMEAEMKLKEVMSKNEVFQAEVNALKILVLTSTPSMPNRQLHHQLKAKKERLSLSRFIPSRRRVASDEDRKEPISGTDTTKEKDAEKECDPVYLEQFHTWRSSKPADLNKDAEFLKQILNDDVIPCLSFENEELSKTLFESILSNMITIEPFVQRTFFPRKCAFTQTSRCCSFKVQIQDSQKWHIISQKVRNRIVAVSDLFSYLRYIIKGLVKSDDSDIYWEIIRLRKEISLARLGLR